MTPPRSVLTSGLCCVLAWASVGVFVVPNPAQAWWNLWVVTEPNQPPLPPPPSGLRESDCTAGSGDATPFGQTGFMRGSLDRASIRTGDAAALAAIAMAGTPPLAEAAAAPLIMGDDPFVARVAAVALARWLLSRAHGLDDRTGALARADALLSAPALEQDADALYLRAVRAMDAGDWDSVMTLTNRAVIADPVYYDALVLHALGGLRQIGAEALDCGAAAIRIEAAIAPVLATGACPTHVAHFDLAADRFGTVPGAPQMLRDRLLRQITLSYVSRNDAECRRLADALRAMPAGGSCAAALARLPCAGPAVP